MRVAGKIKRLFGNLLRRDRIEDSLDAELRAYVEELTHREHRQRHASRGGAAAGAYGSGRN